MSPRRSPPQLYPPEPKNVSKNREYDHKSSAKLDSKKIKREGLKEAPLKIEKIRKSVPPVGSSKKPLVPPVEVKDIKEKSKHKKEDRRKGTGKIFFLKKIHLCFRQFFF